MYSTKGNQICLNQEEVHIKGVSRPGLEYLYVDLPAMIPETIESDLQRMKQWGFNLVRLPLRDKHWFENQQYREMVHYWVQKIRDYQMIILLDLHTQGNSYGLDPFMIKRPVGEKDAFTFWNEVSTEFGSMKDVWFEIFNEPHDISPQIWWNGNDQFYGYKDMLQIIRQHSQNICLIGGLDWAYEWAFLPQQSFWSEVKNQTNLILTTHPYGYRGKPDENGERSQQIPTQIQFPKYNDSFSGDCSQGITIPMISSKDFGWNESFGFLHSQGHFPVIATEFGLDRPETALQGGWYLMELSSYFRQQKIGFVAWAWVQDRIDYPSLLGPNFEPTGAAFLDLKGPPCSSRQNQFYPGPGKVVHQLLKENISHKRYLLHLTEEKVSLPPSLSISLLFPFFYLLYKWKTYKTWSSEGRQKTRLTNNSDFEEEPQSFTRIFSDCQLRNRSSQSLA